MTLLSSIFFFMENQPVWPYYIAYRAEEDIADKQKVIILKSANPSTDKAEPEMNVRFWRAFSQAFHQYKTGTAEQHAI